LHRQRLRSAGLQLPTTSFLREPSGAASAAVAAHGRGATSSTAEQQQQQQQQPQSQQQQLLIQKHQQPQLLHTFKVELQTHLESKFQQTQW
jgi:hypothetical protein